MNTATSGNLDQLTIGVVMLDTQFPRLPGDIGHPATLSGRGLYRRVSAATVASVVSSAPIGTTVMQPVLQAAIELEALGAEVIVTSCGFLHEIQARLQQQIAVPVISSALAILPGLMAAQVREPIGIMTFDARRLTERHLGGAPLLSRCTLVGMEFSRHFHPVIAEDRSEADVGRLRADVLEAAESMRLAHPSVVILECTNLSPWKREIQDVVGVPVFDLMDAVRMRVRNESVDVANCRQGTSESASS